MEEPLNKDWEQLYKNLAFTIFEKFHLVKDYQILPGQAVVNIYQSVDKDIMKIIEDYNKG